MIIGIGTDLTAIKDIEYLLEHMKEGALERMFTKDELVASNKRSDRAACLAGRFAAKEAVFKAICGNFTYIEFDFRQVETRRMPNGAPKFVPSIELLKILNDIGAGDILISISNQGDSAIAIAELIK